MGVGLGSVDIVEVVSVVSVVSVVWSRLSRVWSSRSFRSSSVVVGRHVSPSDRLASMQWSSFTPPWLPCSSQSGPWSGCGSPCTASGRCHVHTRPGPGARAVCRLWRRTPQRPEPKRRNDRGDHNQFLHPFLPFAARRRAESLLPHSGRSPVRGTASLHLRNHIPR